MMYFHPEEDFVASSIGNLQGWNRTVGTKILADLDGEIKSAPILDYRCTIQKGTPVKGCMYHVQSRLT